jgi:tetratricopeptide (TPR) repeat protein
MQMPQARPSNKNKYLVVIITLLLISISAYVYLFFIKPTPLLTGTVLVLPVNVKLAETDLQWNRYAAMDMLINQLKLGVNYPLLQTEDVINIISLITNGNLNNDVDIKQMMAVSGAVSVIESTLTSTSKQYQLVFTLHQLHHTKTGIVNASSIEQALLTASDLISQQINPQHSKAITQFHSRFNSPQWNSALMQLLLGDTVAAEQHLSALIDSTPDNLVAMRLLASIQLQHQQYTLLNSTLTTALNQAKQQQDQREMAKLRLLLAQSYTQTNKIESALGVLSIAKTNAAKVSDWLTLGYISQLSGMINQRIGRNDVAREQFKKAIEYHQMMSYPIGQTLALNDLAELEVIEHNYPQAYRYIHRSYDLVAHRGLDDLEKTTFAIMSKIENKIQHR